MIEKVNKCIFPNQAIPSIYGESLSYSQEVAFLAYKLNECIDKLNSIAAGGLPPFTAAMEEWGPQIINGEVAWTPTVKDLNSDMITVKATQNVHGRKIDSILDNLAVLSEVQSEILSGEVE